MRHTLLQHNADEAAAELERGAFNAAFYELGLRWYWDSDTYRNLSAKPCDRSRLQCYLEDEQSHMLRAYDAGFLIDAILAVRQRCRVAMAKCPPRAVPSFNWADARWGEVGI